jgi:two-component system LytT family response regulator
MESEGNYTMLVFGHDRPMLARPLSALEQRLDPTLFFRANRRQIMNLQHVASIEPAIDGGLRVTLAGGIVVAMSRRQARRFRTQAGL